MKKKSVFFCRECGHKALKWLGKCPECGKWNTFNEEEKKEKAEPIRGFKLSNIQPRPIKEIEIDKEGRILTGISEFDRLLGGGIVDGSLVLLGGPPGIGKSTLLLQVANNLAKNRRVLYISGEESPPQVKIRANRINTDSDDLFIFSETELDEIFRQFEKIKPKFLIIDSIQTAHKGDLSGMPGSVGQVRECAAELLNFAKSKKIPVFISSHITKEGVIAGPKILEHIVDTVLYFADSKNGLYRTLRVEKNRFGPTSEIGIFEMDGKGLHQVIDPSKIFTTNSLKNRPGTCVVSVVEGTRPILVELQALVSRTKFSLPRRQVSGLDYNRMFLLIALLEKRVNLGLENWDVFLNVAGGLKVYEPAVDLGIIMAIYSEFKNIPFKERVVVVGEVGLGGEIRPVSFIEKRIAQAEKLGFDICLIPQDNLRVYKNRRNFSEKNLCGKIKTKEVSTIEEAVNYLKTTKILQSKI